MGGTRSVCGVGPRGTARPARLSHQALVPAGSTGDLRLRGAMTAHPRTTAKAARLPAEPSALRRVAACFDHVDDRNVSPIKPGPTKPPASSPARVHSHVPASQVAAVVLAADRARAPRSSEAETPRSWRPTLPVARRHGARQVLRRTVTRTGAPIFRSRVRIVPHCALSSSLPCNLPAQCVHQRVGDAREVELHLVRGDRRRADPSGEGTELLHLESGSRQGALPASMSSLSSVPASAHKGGSLRSAWTRTQLERIASLATAPPPAAPLTSRDQRDELSAPTRARARGRPTGRRAPRSASRSACRRRVRRASRRGSGPGSSSLAPPAARRRT